MNRSNTTPHSFSTDQLRTALGDAGGPARPDYLTDIVAQAGRTRQRPTWTFLGRWSPVDIAVRRQGVPRVAVVFATLVLLALLAAAGIYVGSQVTRPVDLGIVEPVAPSPSVDSTASPSVESASPPDYMWPQTSLDEVHQAQGLADAGDPRYAWQVDRDLGDPVRLGQHHPGDAKIFTRFLEEVLGWEEYRDGHHMPRVDRASLGDGEVVYIRCAGGETNPLYPNDADGQCAPTIDELSYETVKITVAQPDRQGASGIWLVTGWEMIGPAEQTAPLSDAEIRALVEPFVQARIDGHGAEDLADFADGDPNADGGVGQEIPLLYATSTGAPYERSEFEVVEGPTWPEGGMQLQVRMFTEHDATVVEQRFSLERDEQGRLRPRYVSQPGGPAGPVPATIEDGKAVPGEHGVLDGEVIYRVADPLGPSSDGFNDRERVAIVGTLPDDGAPRRVLLILADPRPIGPGCVEAPAPADAEELARSIRSDPDFEATAPVETTIGGISALQMDVLLVPGASSCEWSEHGTSGEGPLLLKHAPFAAPPFFGDRARLYLLDLPGGSGRVLAMATISDEDSLETMLEWAAPILESIEFRVPQS